MSEKETCKRTVDDGTFRGRKCGRPVVEAGLCALHRTVERKRQERTEKADAEWMARQALVHDLAGRAKDLEARLGISVSVYHARSQYPNPTGHFVVKADDLERIARELGKL